MMHPGACDCHMHIYDARFPAVAGARLLPPDASVQDYRAVQRRLGLERAVVVTPSTYGTDNACTMDAIAQLGAQARGVAVVASSITATELQELHERGIRGIRFNQTLSDVTSLEDLEPLASRIAPLGWHIEILLRADELAPMEARLAALPVPVVLDHLGRLPAPAMTHPGYCVIRRLLDTGHAWMKLSGAYLCGDFAEAEALARGYLAAAPERMLWGSNWPHPTATAGLHAMPDDLDLLARLAEWARSAHLVARVLVDNPRALYGFA